MLICILQDANECWVEIVRSLQQKLTVTSGTEEVQVVFLLLQLRKIMIMIKREEKNKME